MRYPSEQFRNLLNLLQCTSKKEFIRRANAMTIQSEDFVALILGAQHGALAPYLYANHFERYIPPGAMPNEHDAAALKNNGVGRLEPPAQKFANKLFQAFQSQRAFAAHLLYTPDYRHWHLFYFDQRDRGRFKNHWDEGPHIHYTSELFGLKLTDIWPRVLVLDTSFKTHHIRYKNTRLPATQKSPK
ncbi:hypothetical protein ACSUZJ_07490 [Telluria sp. B2]